MDYLQSLRSSTHLLRNLQFFREISHHRSTQSRYGLGAIFGAHPIPGPISKLSQERGKKRRGRGEKREEKGTIEVDIILIVIMIIDAITILMVVSKGIQGDL